MQLPVEVDERALEHDLRARVRGDVRFTDGDRALYATDASNYRQLPIGVVIPRDADDIVATVDVCRAHGAPVLPRGGGTSLAGQGCNVAVVIDTTKHLGRVVSIDQDAGVARVQPGLVLDDLRAQTEPFDLTFGPDPATHDRCTFGGMIGNNSCGVHSVMAGKTDTNVIDLDVLTSDGLRMRVGETSDQELERILAAGGRRAEIYRALVELRDRTAHLIRERFPAIPRRVSGYNLDWLLPENGFNVARAIVGSEGTCVTVLEATVRLVPWPRARVVAAIGFADIAAAADAVPQVLQHGPIGLEGIDDRVVGYNSRLGARTRARQLLPPGGGWLLAEFGGETAAEAGARAADLAGALTKHSAEVALIEAPEDQKAVWDLRASALGTAAHVTGEPIMWEGWEDAAVPPDRLGDYLRDFRGLLDRFGYTASLYGHFGDGCIHTRIDFDFTTTPGIERFRDFVEHAADLVISYGGSLSGEHGDGQARAELLPKMFGPELVEAFREFKTIWDPAGLMNPGKLVDPYKLDENLRLDTGWPPPDVETHFAYPSDDGSFARAMLRCVGVGKCRQTQGGVMCPSYMVTREEEHSTRGRAHLLFEMMKGDPVRDGWRDETVKDALDLCLSCKACRTECPVNVDMATYKAEFLAHYYEGRARPRSAYAFGLINRWARAASFAPGLVNAMSRAPGLSRALKAAGGIAPERAIPRFAKPTFRRWFGRRPKVNIDGPAVLLWPDTFTNYIEPRVGRAAVEVLEHAGYRVEIPARALCCGRPLYDFGMLTTAKRMLRKAVAHLEPRARAGVPIVGLEPSCIAVFRDELPNLFPTDEAANLVSASTLTLTEFLEREDASIPSLDRKAIVQAHCHHSAVMGFDAEEAVLQKTGLDVDVLDSGCCGMAGAFGFEKDHYDVSIAAAERVLLPAVRAADPGTLVLADGFSCREQIRQTTGRRALHVAELLAMGLGEARDGQRLL